MAEQEHPPFANVDPATAADARRQGRDPRKLDQAAENVLSYIYATLPSFPVYPGTRLPALAASPDGVDRISRLPDKPLRNIVARLPVKDAARTAVLSSRWRALWPSTPLVLIDSFLLPKGQGFRPTPANSPALTAAISDILEAHPGPFRCIHLVCTQSAYQNQLARWLQLLAAKAVQDLVLVNRPWPRDVPLPPTLFAITTLTRLYLGLWKLPDTAALRGASFPHLRELGLCSVEMEHGVVDSLVARSPVLEVLNILGCINGLRLRLLSQSLPCLQISCSKMEHIAVVKSPCLERLILFGSGEIARGLCIRLKIGDVPMLHAFGYLDPGQVLQVRDTIIMPGIASTSTMVRSVKILSLNVRFGVRNEVKMVPNFLRCFPNAERLHILSEKCHKPTGNHLSLKFWEESGPIENVLSRINVMSIREFRGDPGEVGFLEFFFQNARALKTASVSMANPSFTPFSTEEAYAKVKYCYRNKASKSCQMAVIGSTGPSGGEVWRFKDGADFSFHDPFSQVEVR
ncbi:hypothetical protein ACQJBY_019433 [Aegilops geniculata]